MIIERDTEREERPAPLVWLRRILVVASVVVTGWLLLGGSSAEAATTGALDATGGPPLTGVDAGGATMPGGAGILEPAAGRVTDTVAEQVQQRSRSLRGDSTASTGAGSARRVKAVQVVDGAVRAVETLPAVIAAARPVVGPVREVTPAVPGEPGVAGNDREAPGSGVGAPGGVLGHGPESSAVPAEAARPSSESSRAPGGLLSAGSGTGAAGGPVLPEPVLPVPGPSDDVPDGIASGGGAHGSLDRGQGVSTGAAPLVVAPELVWSVPAAGRSTGHPERASRPSVSPD